MRIPNNGHKRQRIAEFVGCSPLRPLYGGTFSVKKKHIRNEGLSHADQGIFDAETVRLLGIAFEMALAALRPTPDWADPLREVVARKIIALAKVGERDPERLCEGALNDLGPAVSDPNLPPPPAAPPAPPDS